MEQATKNRKDEVYMRRCLHLARLGEYAVAPNPMVGAVLVNRVGEVIAEGWHHYFGGPHAEVECIQEAERRKLTDYQSYTLYVSLEPCSHFGKTPPCVNLIMDKGIGRVVVGMQDPNPLVAGRGIRTLREHGIEVVVGVLEADCREVNKRFICIQEKKRPYVILKWAQSADGFMDIIRPEKSLDPRSTPIRISTDVTKHIVHKMRAENMAILVGSNTVLLDNPHLLNRKWSGRHPFRILLDRRRRVPQDANIFSFDAPTIVYSENTNWNYILSDIAARGIHSVLVEGGAVVLNHILATGIWDETHIEVSPILLKSGIAAPAFPNTSFCFEKIDGNLLYVFFQGGDNKKLLTKWV